LTKMRGNPSASILLLSPAPSAEDYSNDLPLSDADAKVFHNLCLNAGFHTDKDCLVAPCSLFRAKPSKLSTAPMVEFVGECHPSFSKFICVGDDAFKFIFGDGRKPSMQTLGGSVVYVSEVDHKPMFVFPSIKGLSLPKNIPNDDVWKHERFQAILIRMFEKLMPKFKAFLKI
jgi:uracil-DNA glycosylase